MDVLIISHGSTRTPSSCTPPRRVLDQVGAHGLELVLVMFAYAEAGNGADNTEQSAGAP